MRRRSSPLPAYRLDGGAGPQWLEAYLQRMADHLRSAPPGETLLIEQWWDGRSGEVRLLPYTQALVLAIEALRQGIPLSWTRSFGDPACVPPPGLQERWVTIAPDSEALRDVEIADGDAPSGGHLARAGNRSRRAGTDPPVGPVVDFLPKGQPYWLGLQTHWTTRPDGEVWTTTRGRLAATTPETVQALASALEVCVRRRADATSGPRLIVREVRSSAHRVRAWNSGARSWWDGPRPHRLVRERAVLAAPLPLGPDPYDDPRLRHAVVLGASGSGKTAALAHFARRALMERRSVILFDVHGDLAPRVMAGLSPGLRERLVGVDVVDTPAAVPGLSVFGPVPPADREALVAHLVAAFKRLSTENGETFWGFRLERLFETFLHVVQEQGGDLVDLWSLLTDPRRREAARLSTARPEFAQFLEELDAIVRRQPEFLWPAASRVAKVVGSPLLTALLAPRERPFAVGAHLVGGGSAIWRLPIGELGPEGVTFAVTLLLTRVYLEQVRLAVREGSPGELRVLFVLDEAHLFPARLLSEIVAEGRKFGLGLIVATQYPARLAPELRDALCGAAGSVYLFRTPWASAAATGSWAGLEPEAAHQLLPSLPPGWAVVGSTGSRADRQIAAMPPGPSSDLRSWQELVRQSAGRYGSPVPYPEGAAARSPESLEEDLLLALVALDAEGSPATRPRLLRWLEAGDSFDPVVALETLERLVPRGWVRADGDRLELSAAGADRVGLTARTGARPESAEHRALLVAAVRIFARHHERLEVLRQGRFDTRLPDGRLTVLPREHLRWNPVQLATYLDRRRGEWMWRAFGGRDVHVEAEVSGATRRERIERDWEKARNAGAFLLCLVSDAGRARSVRRYLSRAAVPRDRATVWTLRPALPLPAGTKSTS